MAGRTECREVHYSGQVQGVGFRYTTRNIAGRFAVTGFVQNLPDGRVLLVAEGEAGELDLFLAALGTEMGRHIRGAQITVRPATGEFVDFQVRH